VLVIVALVAGHGRLTDVECAHGDGSRQRASLQQLRMPLYPCAIIPPRRDHGDDELVEMGAVRHRGFERAVIRRTRIFRQSPEAVAAPGRYLLVREVVILGR
jgi:hypothetical protein